jgi:lysophospholipase L1-like esterase
VRRPGRGELLLLAASVALVLGALGAAEGWLRWGAASGDTAADPGDLARLHVYSERYGWELRRNLATRIGGRPVTINAAGYRGALAGPPQPGVERVLVLGDSIAFGLDVGDRETFAALLERPGRREVLNLAVQGYGTDQQALRLEHEGLALAPDVVVLALCVANDFTDVALDHFLYDPRHPKPYFMVRRGELELHDEQLKLGVAGRLGRWLGERSRLFRYLADRDGEGERPGWHWQRTVEEQEPRWAQNVSIVSRLVRRMAEASREAGAGFLVVAFPFRRSWDEGGTRELEELARILAQAEVPLLDLRLDFQERGLRFEDLTVDKLGHLSAAGHRATAEALDAALGVPGDPAPGS